MCGFWIELARGLLSARRWPAGTLMGVPGRVVRWKGGSLMPDVSFTELPGRRVVVRRFGPQDVAEFAAYRSDAEVARYQSWDAPYPPEEGERFVAQLMTAHPDTPGEWFQFAVALRATGQLIGDCAAMVRADDPSQCEIGFTIAPRYQGRGYATEAVRLLVGYLFARGKHRITACCDPRNAASAAVLERLGMRREGHLRQSTWAKGEWTDDLLYALLQEEWPAGPE
jgi:RimJ/RimL family protein N-acetyltransferase